MRPNGRPGWIAVMVLACALMAVGCSTPTSPGAVVEGGGAPVTNDRIVQDASSATPEDFAARGWECRTSPVPGRVVCSHPNQGFPVVPPPADRPVTYQLKAWQNGVYAGNILLIRPDIYNGQRCESTDEPFIYRPVIGYYECLHSVGD